MKTMIVKPRALDDDNLAPADSAARYLHVRLGSMEGKNLTSEQVLGEGAALVSALMALASNDEQRKAMAGMILEVTTIAVNMGDKLDEIADIFGDTQQTHLM